MMELSKKYYLATLGCAKNEVDSEALEFDLMSAGLTRTDRVDTADLLLVNSCGFINDAKMESIETALDLHRSRKDGSILVMCGCLPARYSLEETFGEVDLFLPSDAHNRLVPYLSGIGWAKHETENGIKRVRPELPYAYLKISEGCDNRCSYCAIPDIKGPLSSRPIDELTNEAEFLCGNSVKELVLIAQDTTLYGTDRKDRQRLPQLIDRLVRIDGLEWLRIMYAHPAHLTEEIIEVLAERDKVLKYIDLPLQHINDKILQKMNRKIDGGDIHNLIERIRKIIPGIVLRTTLIVGFPGETDADFKELLDFCEDIKFDNLGLFKYSPEEGTPAYRLQDRLAPEIVEERYLTLLSLQNKISEAKLSSRVGETQRILIQGIEDNGVRIGRTWYQAPEVDGITYVEDCTSMPGEMVEAIISKADAYDLNAVPLKKE